MNKARVIAYYLPQFHPIPENDDNWGKGFTEWTNVANAKPLWRGHHQPRIPKDLGFYDLRLQETRIAQAEMAREAGVEGFMYWHYWFGGGKMLLEKPLEWVLEEGKPDFPFCFGWANHSWSNSTWVKEVTKKEYRRIAEMKYLGTEDNRLHFDYCLPFFKDHRYVTVDGKPLFVIYDPLHFEGLRRFIEEWRLLALENGLGGIYFVGIWRPETISFDKMLDFGLDGIIPNGRCIAEQRAAGSEFLFRARRSLAIRFNFASYVFNYSDIMSNMYFEENRKENCFPMICPGYDCTPRRGRKADIYKNPTPQLFQRHIHNTLDYIKNKSPEHKLIFLDSWNEWGEGNYMEPDTKWGHGYLDALRTEITE